MAVMEHLFRDRIIGFDRKSADQFLANPHNWRKHPQRQRDAVHGSLKELGWVDTVIENRTTGNLIDGHERVWQALQAGEGESVPYIQVELSEEEERLALAILDPLTNMAETDAEMLDELLQDVHTADEHLMAMLSELAERNGLYLDGVVVDDPLAEWQGMPEFDNEPKAARTLYIHFRTEEDVRAFAEMIGQTVTDRTKALWYPEKPENLHMDKTLIYQNES